MEQYERRYSRWYELVLMNRLVQFVAGLFFVVFVPVWLEWGVVALMQPALHGAVQFNSMLTVGLAFSLACFLLYEIGHYSNGTVWGHIGSVVTGVFFLVFALILFLRIDYSRSLLLLGYILSMAWCFAGGVLARRYRREKIAVVPVGAAWRLESTRHTAFRQLHRPDLEGVRYDAIVADLRGSEMTPEWERFLARCILSRIPVFHVRHVKERITGQVAIEHLSENAVGALLPSLAYMSLKRFLDVLGVLVTLPVTVPLMLITALAIRLDSSGSVLFVQDRVGLGDRDFRIYKFRSMRVDSENSGARFAASDDNRITRVGAFIRRTRLDELPQLWNVLKGDMSCIGPRPEQRAFVDQFNGEIPFYVYRHVVRPGITGWAQVTQGYAAGADETRVKIRHDFYYIKHFSFWLDVLITLKTIRILLTGWGAR